MILSKYLCLRHSCWRYYTSHGQLHYLFGESIREDDLIVQKRENLLGMWVCEFQIHELTYAKHKRHGWIFTPARLPETLLRSVNICLPSEFEQSSFVL